MREYWHVFAAYAVTTAAIAFWFMILARRLARLERRVDGEDREGRSSNELDTR